MYDIDKTFDFDRFQSHAANRFEKTPRLAEVIPLGKDAYTLTEAPLSMANTTGKWFFLSDYVALVAAFILGGIATVLWGSQTLDSLFSYGSVREFLIFVCLGSVAILWFDTKGHYRNRIPTWESIGHIVGTILVGLVMGGFIEYAMRSSASRLWLATSWMLFGGFLYLGRVAVRHALSFLGKWEIPAIIIGRGPTAAEAQKAFASEPEMGYRIVAALESDKLDALAKPGAWAKLLKGLDAQHIFLALEGADIEKHKSAIRALGRDRLPYAILPSWRGLPLRGLSTHYFAMHDVMLLQDTNPLHMLLPRLMKRAFDILVAGSATLVLLPLFTVVALAVRSDGGPVFFNQPRIGKGGKVFNCYKFRSMRTDAEKVLERYLAADPDVAIEWEKFQKLRDDPRITRVGSLLRRTSIDELPQLLNVLTGDMSLVGPRPIMLGQESYYGDDFSAYCSVRPGITGPWQVSGRNKLTFPQRVQLEAWYTRNWTLWLDIVIILKTVPVILHRDGAF